MYPTLEGGDQTIMRVFNYDEPERGDIVVLMAYDYKSTEPLVKRVIGIGGDVIDISSGGDIILNGEVLYEPYISEPIVNRGSIDYPYVVPDGHVFAVGDNRNGSTDSRSTDIGSIPYEDIIGKVVFRIWPFTSIGSLA